MLTAVDVLIPFYVDEKDKKYVVPYRCTRDSNCMSGMSVELTRVICTKMNRVVQYLVTT